MKDAWDELVDFIGDNAPLVCLGVLAVAVFVAILIVATPPSPANINAACAHHGGVQEAPTDIQHLVVCRDGAAVQP